MNKFKIIALSLFSFIFGLIVCAFIIDKKEAWNAFGANIMTEGIGILVTVLVVDRIYERREEARKTKLTYEHFRSELFSSFKYKEWILGNLSQSDLKYSHATKDEIYEKIPRDILTLNEASFNKALSQLMVEVKNVQSLIKKIQAFPNVSAEYLVWTKKISKLWFLRQEVILSLGTNLKSPHTAYQYFSNNKASHLQLFFSLDNFKEHLRELDDLLSKYPR